MDEQSIQEIEKPEIEKPEIPKPKIKKTKIPKPGVWQILLEIAIRALILLVATVLLSVIYKLIINTGIFGFIQNQKLCRIIFCGSELLLLGVYWHYVFIFAKISRHCSYNLKTYYVQTGVVFLTFGAAYWLSYILMSREQFLCFFRLTVNLIGVRLLTYAPDNLIPYMLTYLGVMLLIMFLEPTIAIRRFMARKRWMKK